MLVNRKKREGSRMFLQSFGSSSWPGSSSLQGIKWKQFLSFHRVLMMWSIPRHSPGLQAIAYTLKHSFKELLLLVFLITISGFIFARFHNLIIAKVNVSSFQLLLLHRGWPGLWFHLHPCRLLLGCCHYDYGDFHCNSDDSWCYYIHSCWLLPGRCHCDLRWFPSSNFDAA